MSWDIKTLVYIWPESILEVKVQKVQIYSTDILIGLSQMHQYMSSYIYWDDFYYYFRDYNAEKDAWVNSKLWNSPQGLIFQCNCVILHNKMCKIIIPCTTFKGSIQENRFISSDIRVIYLQITVQTLKYSEKHNTTKEKELFNVTTVNLKCKF